MVQLGHSIGEFSERTETLKRIPHFPLWQTQYIMAKFCRFQIKFSVLVIIIMIKQTPGEGQDNTIPNRGRVILFSTLHWESPPHPTCLVPKFWQECPTQSNFTLSLNKAMHEPMLWTSFAFVDRSLPLYATLRILRCLLLSLSEDKQRNLDQQTGLYFNNLLQYTVLLIALKKTGEFDLTLWRVTVRGSRIDGGHLEFYCSAKDVYFSVNDPRSLIWMLLH